MSKLPLSNYLLYRVQVLDLVRHDLDALLESNLGVEEGLRVAQDHVVQLPLVVAEDGEPLLHLRFCGTDLRIRTSADAQLILSLVKFM